VQKPFANAHVNRRPLITSEDAARRAVIGGGWRW
jgi:hypothetical protein